MSIADKISALNDAKSAIASAIESKGGTVTGGFSSFAEDISNLPSGGGSVLPSAYQQVEYIESTGTQYIDTLVKINSNMRWEIRCSMQNLSSNSKIGMTSGFDSQSRCGLGAEGGKIYIGLAEKNTTTSYTNDENAHTFVMDLLNKKGYIDGIQYASCSYSYYASYNYTGVFFATRGSNNALENYSKAKFYNSKIYLSDELIRDYIPCYRKSDGVIGLYDIIYDNFYVNKGTGTFIKGADV